MDLRIQKTLRLIRSAFLELAAKKPIEQITVKELCENAMINKATFYSHYDNIYVLIDQLENEVVDALVGNIKYIPLFLDSPDQFIWNLADTYQEMLPLSDILIHSSRNSSILEKATALLRKSIYEVRPDLQTLEGFDITLTFLFYGMAGIFSSYKETDIQLLTDKTSQAIKAVLENVNY